MNRLSNWFSASKLARLHLAQAKEDLQHGKTDRSISNILSAVDELLVGINNVASIGFNTKPKRKKNLKLIALFCFIATAARAQPICQTGAVAYANPAMEKMGETPRTDCLYSLNQLAAFQKVKGGYLMRDAFADDPDQAGVLFLETTEYLDEGRPINGPPIGRYTGLTTYQALNGFERTIYAFKVEMP